MTRLPIIVGFGGINSAGRSSHHHGYRRLVYDALPESAQLTTLKSLALLTGELQNTDDGWINATGSNVDPDTFVKANANHLIGCTLIRQLEDNLFDPQKIYHQTLGKLSRAGSQELCFKIKNKHFPTPLPESWQVTEQDEKFSVVSIPEDMDVLLPSFRPSLINSAGQLPSGFDPAALYASRNHPRGLQLTVYAASDALNSIGIDWDTIRQNVAPDKISVYAGSGLSQLDYHGNGGLLQARLLGKKVSSKQLALGYAEMPADFINAYLIGNLGTTGTNVAACATFLYNLRQGIKDIQSGSSRVAIIGTSEAPLTPEVFEGFATMGALADDESLRRLEGLGKDQALDYTRACRPFGANAGFTLSESSQVIVLFDDELTLELGATVYGAVNDVFINADGYKKSIASPGLGNYLSMAKAAAATANIIGPDGLKHRSYVQAHGTGTPQNRQTESKVLNDTAKRFGINHWPVTAIKSFLGHSLASSAGDQIMASLGFWNDGILPGILTVDEIAEDVATSAIDFKLQHENLGATSMDATLINSKGFGGNNASASILAPHITKEMLAKRHGKNAIKNYLQRNESVATEANHLESETMKGRNQTIYKFDNNVMGGDNLTDNEQGVAIDGIDEPLSLSITNPYSDMCD